MSQPKNVWHVPFDQMPDFVGREAEISTLKDKLFQPNQGQTVAVFGLGGVGKSRVAWEMANHAKTIGGYSVLWVQATSVSTLENDYLEAGTKLDIPALRSQKKDYASDVQTSRAPGLQRGEIDVKSVVSQWLDSENSGRWLMILDNADDESIWNSQTRRDGETTALFDFIPKSHRGSILVTTRSRRIAVRLARTHVIEMSQMNSADAVNTLNSLLIEPEGADAATDSGESSALVRQLSYLPLAIVQAAAYINENGLAIYEYLELLKDAGEEDIIDLLSEDFEDETRYRQTQNSIASTWLISFKQIQKSNVKAINFLSYIACMCEKDIPRTLLPETSSKKELVDIIGTLTSYSFIKKQPQERHGIELYDIHRLVRLATRNWLRNQGSLDHWLQLATKRVSEVFPTDRRSNRKYWTLYMPHAEILCAATESWNLAERYVLLRKIGRCLTFEGAFGEAVKRLTAVLQWKLQQDTESTTETLQIRAELGHALAENGDWDRSEEYLTEALAGQEYKLGQNHSDTLVTRGRLATVYRLKGRWTDALRLEEDVMGASKRLYGLEHGNTLSSMGSLAVIYVHLGQLEKAEKLEKQVLEITTRICGADHPYTVASVDHLAAIYSKLGRYKEAEKLGFEAAETSRRVLGEEHPYRLRILDNLADIFQRQKEWDIAEDIVLEVLKLNRKVLGPLNPDTLQCMVRLGAIYWEQKRYDEALQIDEDTLKLSKKVLGVSHPRTLSRMEDLARTMNSVGYKEDAYYLLADCVDLSIKTLGADHPVTRKRRERMVRWLNESQPPKKVVVNRARSF